MATKQNATASGYKYEKWTPDKETTALKEKADSFGTYSDSDNVIGLLGEYNKFKTDNNPGVWDAETESKAHMDAYNAIVNRPKFSYDLNGDALYQQYKDKYINQGRLAMADTIGQASAMTGGYGNSYAVTAGSQAYQSHLQNLNDIVPQLYQMAYDRYNQEGQDLMNQYSLAKDMYNTKYGEHRDNVADFNNNLDRLYNTYTDLRNFEYGTWDADRNYYLTAYDNAYKRDYGEHTDEQNRLYQLYRDRVADDQWQASYDLQQKSYNLQEKAALTEKSFEGLSFKDSEVLKGLAEESKWDDINKYIASMNLSEEDTAYLAKIWLPESYLNPTLGKDARNQNQMYYLDKNTYNTMY